VVADDSTTETFAAVRLEIDNWRWEGVPFFIRTGKRLPVTQTEVWLVFRRPPRIGFQQSTRKPEPDQLVIKLDPTTGMQLLVEAQRGDARQPEQVTLDMEFAQEGGEGATPYEVLLHAAMMGDAARFTRQDGVEEAWRVLLPLIDAPSPIPVCARLPGPGRGRHTARRPGTLARTVGGESEDAAQSAAMPSRSRPRRLRSSRTATRAPWSPPTARRLALRTEV
jgi:hypothetical protein